MKTQILIFWGLALFLLLSCNKAEEMPKEVYKFQLIENRICVNIIFNDSIKGSFVLDNETGGVCFVDSEFLKKEY